ncbi:MAG: TnpV protein [Firmicutes bacterium]|nr:TnpV protein [Bacillota bacterium]
MVLTETLFSYLWEVQQTCEKRMDLLMAYLLMKNPAPDKATQQLALVSHMNNLKAQAEEIVASELIYN